MINEFFLLKILKKNKKILNEKENFFIKLSKIRNYKITKDLIGLRISIYNGKYYIPLKITEDMVGNFFGVYAFPYNILIKKKKNKYFEKNKKK